jgi:hypothetical protein
LVFEGPPAFGVRASLMMPEPREQKSASALRNTVKRRKEICSIGRLADSHYEDLYPAVGEKLSLPDISDRFLGLNLTPQRIINIVGWNFAWMRRGDGTRPSRFMGDIQPGDGGAQVVK